MNSTRTLLILACLVVASQSAAEDARLIEAAKKEGGKVVLYGSLETKVVESVMASIECSATVTSPF